MRFAPLLILFLPIFVCDKVKDRAIRLENVKLGVKFFKSVAYSSGAAEIQRGKSFKLKFTDVKMIEKIQNSIVKRINLTESENNLYENENVFCSALNFMILTRRYEERKMIQTDLKEQNKKLRPKRSTQNHIYQNSTECRYDSS